MSDHGHYGKRVNGESRQGVYVFTSTGKFLSSVNSTSPEVVLKTLKTGWSRWESLPGSQKKAAETKVTKLNPKHRWEDYYPRDGLVLTIYNRDLSTELTPNSTRKPTWNRDSAWFSADEVKKFVPDNLKDGLKLGQEFEFEETFISRLARLHFVDSVKGQTDSFDESEIKGSKILGKVVGRDGDTISLKISGKTWGERDRFRNNYGVETKLVGTAEYDTVQKRFTKFEFVALGERWGKTRFNDRRRQMRKSPVGFVFELAEPDAVPVVPGIIWEYTEIPWLKEAGKSD